MSNIAPCVVEIAIPPLEEPEEFCPVALLWLCEQHFYWNMEEFACVFGWNVATISGWYYKRFKPSRQARIMAASLKQKWKI